MSASYVLRQIYPTAVIFFIATCFTAPLAAIPQKGSFEIINKFSKPISIELSNRSATLTDPNRRPVIASQQTSNVYTIDRSVPTYLDIQEIDPQDAEGKNALYYNYEFRPGSDIFVTFNPFDSKKRGPLYPQTGTFKGLSGKSKSGYSLANNVKKDGIIQVSTPL